MIGPNRPPSEERARHHPTNRLKQWRGLAMRTDKLAIAYQAALHVAAILVRARR
ncbi:hypothetical protein GCM10010236_75720 [Streptomyces eurythermus]|nr:hypothetical protein GCM10010236_75720 [Streptomyces eurythermus]